ncbi:Sensory histidine kinase in two-component regulatory system with RstA [Klebsiella oxytoca]|nr:Sensory histidine kinase in two-component regulatory system with RstA [Klebsiella oxytoca]
MKKLFVQFYLLLFVCFLVMTMMVGLVYKFTAERAGRQSLDDLMKSSLYLMRSELREIPPRDWSKTLKELDLNLSFDLHIEPISKFKLSENSMQHLRAGDIVALDDQYTFIQRIPRSHYVLSVGPVPYLYFLHEMRLLDLALMAFIAISLAFPVFIWMRPTGRICCVSKPPLSASATGILASGSTSIACPASNGWAWRLIRWPIISTRLSPAKNS